MDSSTSQASSSSATASGISTMDILAAAFFVIAGAWLLIALMYSTLVLVFLRLRARGNLGSVYEEDFGRIYFCGGRFYISFGCLFRRYLRHLQAEMIVPTTRFMTREERRAAMEALLVNTGNTSSSSGSNSNSMTRKQGGRMFSNSKEVPVETTDDASSSQEPLCSICLGDYEEGEDPVLQSKTCPHQFHEECILDWLERQENTADCPCCRTEMVEEEDVWKMVQKIRKEARRKMKRKKDVTDTKKESTPQDVSETCEDEDFDETEIQEAELQSNSQREETAFSAEEYEEESSSQRVEHEEPPREEESADAEDVGSEHDEESPEQLTSRQVEV